MSDNVIVDNLIIGNRCEQPRDEAGNPISYGIEIRDNDNVVIENCVCIPNETRLQRWWRELVEAFEQL